MAIQKFYKIIEPRTEPFTTIDNQDIGSVATYGSNNWYHRAVQGSASRITKYREYDAMDDDVDVARALDLIAEEMLGNAPKSQLPLEIRITAEQEELVSSAVVVTLKAALKTWCTIQDWNKRLFNIVRQTIKYGDAFFIRPTKKYEKLLFVSAKNVLDAIVPENDITNVLAWNMKTDFRNAHGGSGIGSTGYSGSSDVSHTDIFKASEVVRFTLNNDMSEEAPFGESILRAVYRTFKQKQMLEDAILIYRIQRAPERRVFYIDTGNMPANRIAQHLEQVKNEFRQKKVPSNYQGKNTVESIYDPQCLDLSTEIPLLDGRTLTLSELIAEHSNGKQNWVYSIDIDTGAVVPGIISWAGITRKNAESIKLTLDNGEILICTPDHKIPVKGKGYIEAKDLLLDDSLYSFDLKQKPLGHNKKKQYTAIYDHAINEYKHVHRIVAEFMKQFEDNSFVFDSKYVKYDKNVIHHKDFKKNNNNPKNINLSLDIDKINLIKFILKQISEVSSAGNVIAAHINNDINLINEFNMLYSKAFLTQQNIKLNISSLDRICAKIGYHNFKSLVNNIPNFNHKITKIEIVENRDVGTLTIDGDEKYHSHHNFAIKSGIYVKNSINSDFWFSRRKDGSGSTVEQLDSGMNLGEITDLDWFYKKMWRGLRIPQSYMDSSTEGGAIATDGKVGIAYIQEIVFILYIQRLQKQIEDTLDKEFKRFLYDQNIKVDNTIFVVSLPEPSNYSKSRQQQMDAESLNNYGSIKDDPNMSPRFAMSKYLQLSAEEIILNQRLKLEEMGINPDKATKADLIRIYNPDHAEAGGFDGGLGGGAGSGDMNAPIEGDDTNMDENLDDDTSVENGDDANQTKSSPNEFKPPNSGGNANKPK